MVKYYTKILISSIRISGFPQGKNISSVTTCFQTVMTYQIVLILFSPLYDDKVIRVAYLLKNIEIRDSI